MRNRDLVSEMLPLGKTDHSTCAIMYMAGITNPELIEEVKRRISYLNVDFVMGAGTLEELISDRPYSLFPDITTSERPDRAASFLLDGKVVIVTEGSPFITAVPSTFYEMMISSEESFLKWQFATVLRVIRLLAILTTTLLSAGYVALTTYHQEMIPTDLLISIAAAKENVPFTTLVEMLVMEISFELIREAGLRVPGVIGQTLGIIGALILGQAAVQAGIVTPIMIIIVAVSGLGSFAIPNYSLAFAFRVLKFIFIMAASIAGFYGIAALLIIFAGQACGMKSFGVPYFAPVAPRTKGNPDLLLKLPNFMQKLRPDYLNPLDRTKSPQDMRGWIRKGDQND